MAVGGVGGVTGVSAMPIEVSKIVASSAGSVGVGGAEAGEPATGFGDALKSMLTAVDGTTATANDAVAKMIGGTGDVHEAMIALQRAEVAFQFTVQLRNKLVNAYQDVMRMPI
jgi:flagellar hook-basal body complex protein FliE